mgnify:FL=1|jgi:phosphohistidine phosphatase SixA
MSTCPDIAKIPQRLFSFFYLPDAVMRSNQRRAQRAAESCEQSGNVTSTKKITPVKRGDDA